ncbi:hypothetical protein MNBD_GAMMA12-1836 [hydrothermal vent metagenome]|uniref:Uncharacterized protein n=1 Tax=hydrothermal vent metagenome TaxID=652676 RepID=A0A3B0Z649_9ZZZZ
MDISHLDEHQELALALYRQRKGLLEKNWVDSRILESVESRLRAHLFVLSHYVDKEEEMPDAEHEVFIFLARRILAFSEETQALAWNIAIDCLLEPGAKAEGASTALVLFSMHEKHSKLLEEAYQEKQELRAAILDIWQKTDALVSSEIIRQSDLLSLPKEHQSAIVNYAAHRKEYNTDYFQNYYMSIINGQGEVHLHLLEAAIFAGLVRGDNNARTALLRGIEQYPDTEVQLRLLRLAALTGSPELLGVLEAYTRSSPEEGYYLLALHGNKAAVPVILEGLKQASQIEDAEKGWLLLTNFSLPQIARMYLASDSNDDDYDDEIFELDDEFAEDDESDTVADVAVAMQWWKENREHWPEEERRLKGQAVPESGLASLATLTSGQVGRDLLDALSLELKAPLRDSSAIWFEQRKQFLQEYSNGDEGSDLTMASNRQVSKPEPGHKRPPAVGRPYARAR